MDTRNRSRRAFLTASAAAAAAAAWSPAVTSGASRVKAPRLKLGP
jgi:hypothetical protein